MRGPPKCPNCGHNPTGDDEEFRSGGGWHHDTSVVGGNWIDEFSCPVCGELVAREQETGGRRL
jgi:predicted RNA-binding Zn-ribbon protein involved in translation (DUF1610 family)